MQVKNENETVQLETALAALKEAQGLLDAYRDADTAWQDPVELLNTTASALDDAALAMRNDGASADKEHVQDKKNQALISAVEELSQQIIKDRQAILDATQQVIAGTRPTELWNPKTLIVYATHTGTARDFALELQGHLKGSDVMSIKDVSLLDLQERKRVYFVCSTFGLGRPPRDAEAVYTTLQLLDTADAEEEIDDQLVASSETQALVGLEFAVAALGNSKFEAFCKFGSELANRLSALGGQELLPVTLLDARNGKAEQKNDFKQWQQQVLDVEGVVLKESPVVDLDVQKGAPVDSKCCEIM